jgi:hypothetical protein
MNGQPMFRNGQPTVQVTAIRFPPTKQPLALEAEAFAFGCPEKWAEKGDIFMPYVEKLASEKLAVLWSPHTHGT